jgi:hypothetical protein
MSTVRLPKSWILGAFCALAVGLCGVATVNADDYLNKFKSREQLSQQKVVADVNALMDLALKTRTTNPKLARTYLQDGLNRVDLAASLSEEQRTALRAQLQARLNQLDGMVREQEAEAAIAARRAEEKAIRDLKDKARQRDEAPYKGTYNQSKDFVKTGNSALQSEAALKYKREQGVVAINRDILESASTVTEERFTERFKYRTEREKEDQLKKYTPAERKLLAALNSTMSVDFNKNTTSLKDALDVISERSGLSIFLDEQSVKEALGDGNDYDTVKVGLKANKATVRTILKRVLADQGLTFIIKEAAVQVMSPAKAADPKNMVVRTYRVQDLIQPTVQSPNPYMNRVQMAQQVQGLMLNIMNAIEPGSWAGQSPTGQATITFHEPSMSLIIRHHAEFHYQLGGVLGR